MASFGPDGSIVSTASEGLIFLEAFMTGRLFPVVDLAELRREYRRIFFPLQAGTGILRLALPRLMTVAARVPELIGHSGASGVVLYWAPELDLYVSGTVNQVKQRSLPYQLMVRLVHEFRSARSRGAV